MRNKWCLGTEAGAICCLGAMPGALLWSMCYVWCSFFFQVLCLVQGGAGQLCSWVASNLTWAAGARLELSISNIQQVLVLVLVVMSLLFVVMNDDVGVGDGGSHHGHPYPNLVQAMSII